MRGGAATHDDRAGFVLGLVILLLFAISVAGAAGYMVVSTEFSLSTHNREGREALGIARAGLQRFLAESVGTVGDSVSYAIGDGIATVTTRLMVIEDSLTYLYYLRSEGSILDLRSPQTPAKRVVGAYARHHKRPLAHHSAAMISADEVQASVGALISGYDAATAVDCQGGGTAGITAAIAREEVTEGGFGPLVGTVDGNPDAEIWPGGHSQMYDSVALRWDILSDDNFPVDIEQSWSSATFDALPADSFPLVRYNGSRAFSSAWSGRGVLIVTGEFDAGIGFVWEGIVLAGEVDQAVRGTISGMLVGGLNGANPAAQVRFQFGGVSYHSCNVYAANDALSYLELLENTIFEAN